MTTKQIEKYVGKDLWVKCIWKENKEYYVRFLALRTGGIYSGYVDYNQISPESLDLHESPYTILRSASWLKTFNKDYKIASPLDIKSTSDLFPVWVPTEENLKIFTKFQAKPFWIHVKSEVASPDYGEGGYIKIDKVDGLLVSGVLYEDYYVFDYESLDLDYIHDHEDYPPSELYSVFDVSVDNWVIDNPIEALSDEEFDEIMNHNDAIFEEAKYREDPDDVDDYDDDWE